MDIHSFRSVQKVPGVKTDFLSTEVFFCVGEESRVIKLRRMRWAGYVARMEEGRGLHKVLVGNLGERDHWGDQDVDGRIILRWMFSKWEGVVGTEWSWLRTGTGGGRL